jgi:hypothetical protein
MDFGVYDFHSTRMKPLKMFHFVSTNHCQSVLSDRVRRHRSEDFRNSAKLSGRFEMIRESNWRGDECARVIRVDYRHVLPKEKHHTDSDIEFECTSADSNGLERVSKSNSQSTSSLSTVQRFMRNRTHQFTTKNRFNLSGDQILITINIDSN